MTLFYILLAYAANIWLARSIDRHWVKTNAGKSACPTWFVPFMWVLMIFVIVTEGIRWPKAPQWWRRFRGDYWSLLLCVLNN